MGSCFYNKTNNPADLIYNPANLINFSVNSLSVNNGMLLQSATYNSLYYVHKFDSSTIGLGYNMMALDNSLFIKTDQQGNELGSFDVSNSAMIFSYSRKLHFLKKNNDFAISLKMLQKKVGQYSASGYTAGLYLSRKIWNHEWNFSLNNFIGGTLGSDALPIRINNSISFKFLQKKLIVVPAIEWVESRMDYRCGINYKINNFIDIRSGYEPNKISFGFGITYSDFILNYAFKTVSNSVSSEAVSVIGITYNIGLQKKRRMDIYKKIMREFKIQRRKKDYKKSLEILNNIKNVLKPKSDKEQYSTINNFIEQIKYMQSSELSLINKINERALSYLKKGKSFFQKKQFKGAKYALEKIVPESKYFIESKKLLKIVNKKIAEMDKAEGNQVNKEKIKLLYSQYKKSKDIFLKINLAEKILELEKNPNLKKQLKKLKIVSKRFKASVESLSKFYEISLSTSQINKVLAKKRYNTAVTYFNQGAYEAALSELKLARDLINDKNYHTDLEQQITYKLAELDRKNKVQEAVNSLFNKASNAFFDQDFTKAKNYLERSPIKTKRIKDLLSKVNKMIKQKHIKTTKEKIELTPEEIQLKQAEINKLFNEGKKYYILEKTQEAKKYWNKALKLDPNNSKVKRYLRLLEE